MHGEGNERREKGFVTKQLLYGAKLSEMTSIIIYVCGVLHNNGLKISKWSGSIA